MSDEHKEINSSDVELKDKIASAIVDILIVVTTFVMVSVIVLLIWNVIVVKYVPIHAINIGNAFDIIAVLTTVKVIWNLVPTKITNK